MTKSTIAAFGLIVIALATQLATAQAPNPATQRADKTSVSTATRGPSREDPADSSAVPGRPDSPAADQDLVNRVRRTIMADRNLSSYAPKINIEATDGNVYLSGLVQNEGEKAQIGSKAATVAGQQRAVNDLRAMANPADGAGLRAVLEQASVQRAIVPRAGIVAAAN